MRRGRAGPVPAPAEGSGGARAGHGAGQRLRQLGAGRREDRPHGAAWGQRGGPGGRAGAALTPFRRVCPAGGGVCNVPVLRGLPRTRGVLGAGRHGGDGHRAVLRAVPAAAGQEAELAVLAPGREYAPQ